MKGKILKLSMIPLLALGIFGCGSDHTGSDSGDSQHNGSDTSMTQNRYDELLSYGVTPPLPPEYYDDNVTVSQTADEILSDDTNISNLDMGLVQQLSLQPSSLLNGISWNDNDMEVLPILDQPLSLLIIADASFMEALEPLKDHKNAINMPTALKSWQSLVQTFAAYGVDDPERLKQAIAYYKKNASINYVMLVGDSDMFPVRYCKNYATAGNYWTPTDLYYADLLKEDGSFDTWDANGNHIFCETKAVEAYPQGGLINIDEIDGRMDVVVGRVPASSVSEVNNYVQKVMAYENNTTGGNWKKNALMIVPGEFSVSGDVFQYRDSYPGSLSLKEDIAKHFESYLLTVNRAYYTQMTLTKEEIKEQINAGVGYVNFAGHGSRNGWWLGTEDGTSLGFFDRTDIDHLSNQNRYPIVFSTACDTGKYYNNKAYRDEGNSEVMMNSALDKNPPAPNPIQPSSYDVDSMAEAFLLSHNNSGAIAFIGSTEASQRKGQTLDRYFSHVYAQKMAHTHFLGDIWKLTNYLYIDDQQVDMRREESSDWTASNPFEHLLKYHLFGDPSLRITVPELEPIN